MTESAKATVWVAFAALCLLVANAWLLPAQPDKSPAGQVCFYGVIGLAALLLSRRQLWTRRKRQGTGWLLVTAGASVLLLGLPATLNAWGQETLPDVSRAALFGLTPFVVVVVVSGSDALSRDEPGVRRFFVPTLAAFAGALLLLSFSFPLSSEGRVTMAVVLLAMALAGFASAWMYRLLHETGMMEALAVVCVANAIFYAVFRLPFDRGWNGVSSLLSITPLYSLAELLLLVWLLRRMSPVLLAVRYLAVPLLIAIEAFVILRPPWTVRMGVGLALLAGGAAYVLLSRSSDSDSVLSIR